MRQRDLARRFFGAGTIVWALLVMPVLLLSQGSGQGTTQAPPTPPPPPIPQDGIRVFNPVASRPPGRLADMMMRFPADNPQTDAKIALGRRLFFSKDLSIDRTVSCATCHEPERAFTDVKPLAVGVQARVGRRNSPSLVNRGFGRTQFWDGRAASLEAQAIQPIPDPNEMALPLADAVARLNADASYRAEFEAVFQRAPVAEDVGRAIASYLRTIRSGDSPYDRFIAGDTSALSAEAQAGLTVFRNRGRCVICHVEPMFTDENFHNTGVAWRPPADAFTQGTFEDLGRFEVSQNARERGAFKAPTLREVALTAPYMHDGSLATLEDVVDFYDRGGRQNPNLMILIRPIGLTSLEKQNLIAFLKSLSGTVSGKS